MAIATECSAGQEASERGESTDYLLSAVSSGQEGVLAYAIVFVVECTSAAVLLMEVAEGRKAASVFSTK